MPRFHFHIHENGRLVPDEDGQDFVNGNDARQEAILTGAAIARDAFIAGTAHRSSSTSAKRGPFLKVSITLVVEEA